ncbi:HMG box protein [Colletotrichum graminicola]|uniref:HMG box protein n=1 Tax=Colletotrichum graminicola (strain M1.001 / M2 / FGSC 10212) TaxID=645133 RepID=E3Q6E7_COLGM|nr:HMG box protein [Colletotrichum graminicola M1.001]EFQ26395.1 HMG box protein [Colletotrichum graminicola M1.001]WDK14243.1 HMG box protein [Colletotrichum graminicola]
MLTAIGQAAKQRLFLRAAPLVGLRAQPVVRAARRGFSTSQWARIPAAKASSTTAKTKKSTEAKDGAAPKKKATAKTKTKEKAATKPKKEKKPVLKKPVKVLTPEEKQKLDVKKWKKLALLPDPKRLPTNKWLVYTAEATKDVKSSTEMMMRVKESGELFKNLSSYELQRLQEKADENKLVNNATYKAWVESHTPQDIAAANRARLRLRKASGRLTPAPIRDDRLPTQPVTPYALFIKARWASGDYAGSLVPEVSSRISKEWRDLSESEKGAYRDLSKADRERYERDALDVLGHVVRRRETSQ